MNICSKNPYEFRRYKCSDLGCAEIFSGEEALKEDVRGPAIRYSCPSCGSYKYEEITVCTECLREECAEGFDIGRNCLAAEADALADIALESIRRPKSELSLLCAEIALTQWRRSA